MYQPWSQELNCMRKCWMQSYDGAELKDQYFLTFYVRHKQMKINKRKQSEAWELGKAQSLFLTNLIVCFKNPKRSMIKLAKSIKSFSKVVEYETKMKINSLFIHEQ